MKKLKVSMFAYNFQWDEYRDIFGVPTEPSPIGSYISGFKIIFIPGVEPVDSCRTDSHADSPKY